MNTLVHLDSHCPRPSVRLPCCRLPPRVHLQLCRELEGSDELWEKLALGFRLKEGLREVAPLGSDTVSYFRALGNLRTTTALLEHLWKTKELTVGDMLDAFDYLGIRGSIPELLDDYVGGKLAASDVDRLVDDPRTQVGWDISSSNSYARNYPYVCILLSMV